MKKVFTQACALGVEYPTRLEEQEYDEIRDKFYNEFPICFMQWVGAKQIVVLVPCGMWESAKNYFKNYKLIENLDVIITNERT